VIPVPLTCPPPLVDCVIDHVPEVPDSVTNVPLALVLVPVVKLVKENTDGCNTHSSVSKTPSLSSSKSHSSIIPSLSVSSPVKYIKLTSSVYSTQVKSGCETCNLNI